MTQFQNAIITASAGTGKTYRLSMEYIALILRYYEHPDFRLDSILALTFTRKATAEIRERIILNLEELIKKPDSTLIASLRNFVPGDEKSLSMHEANILLSAWQEITNDLQKLQIMTIDSYTGSIFRNIIRPMKSIDSFDIDENAVEKRMPLLMDHLMKPEFRKRIDKLLSRKVQRSMDDYTKFFQSMIYNRWLFFLISRRCNLQRSYQQQARRDFKDAVKCLAQALQQGIKDPAKKGFADVLLTDVRNLFISIPQSPEEFCKALEDMLQNPIDAMNLFKVFKATPFISKTALAKDAQDNCFTLYEEALKALAEELYYRYFLPEEREILDIWEIILKQYDELAYRYKNMTYQDIAWYTFEALFSNQPPEFDFDDENSANEFYMFLSHRTRFMLIDEFQDTSLIQFNMLRPIMEEICAGAGSKDFGGLVVVGDEKQSIFGWRGGERDLLLNLRQIIAPLRDVPPEVLAQSWRSGEDMMHFINAVFSDPALKEALQAQGMNWPYSNVESARGKTDTTIEVCAKGYSNYYKTGSKVYDYFVDEMILPEYERDPKANIAVICRKGKQLATLQLLLEERGKGGIFQPSAPITEHRFVAPLIKWLRFVCYGDPLDFMAFVRSDFLLLESSALKVLIDSFARYEQVAADETTIPDLSQYPALAELIVLAQSMKQKSPYAILREITGICLKNEGKTPERDLLNLQAFLNIAADWEIAEASRGLRIPDFLSYLDENAKQEAFTQVSVEGKGGIQLLTIHKSKGLQFDKVFVLYDLSPGSHNERELYWAVDYADTQFQNIKDYALSFHFASILPYSPPSELWRSKEKQEYLEELNNLYVAFTRARQNLHILFSYNKNGSWQEFWDSKTDNLGLPIVLADACLRYYDPSEALPNGCLRRSRSYPEADQKSDKDKEEVPVTKLELHLAAPRTSPLEKALANPAKDLDYKNVYLDKRRALYGDLAHHYLSFIIYDRPEEHKRAVRECIERYGSLLGMAKIKRVLDILVLEIRKHSHLFDTRYDKVYTEFAVGNFRVDRLMLDTKAKEAVLTDYKTGGIGEMDQLDRYQAALSAHPALRGYKFQISYVSIHLTQNGTTVMSILV
ncbi:MAG: UvrD-helicase domain-containing protein [Candidatus Cloacimonetes bacterium]|jgi:ATP-dependent exoDNAse (exonuclease V) beta subunit|nr:UvrD-helicase domain-containing protein [Candidatus Cloacimonadota bacterium]MDD2507333.1 UvrD-helicase domain-containing protein [Candidatus Cloacimonadota bacterium]MDD4560245.1 UvrD-helicase domain-containing protein [Candidatus Cloacimonadota bacterium]